jgi:DNA-binding NarL/FixJ family response regulator
MALGEDEVTRIFVADDHPIVFQGLKQLLNREGDLSVCGSAANVNDAIKAIEILKPNLVIVDISLKGSVSGIELIKGIRKRFPNTYTMVLSMYDETLYAERAIRAGARGYVKKEEFTNTIVKAIRQVLSGKIYLSETMTSRLLDNLIYDQSERLAVSTEKLTNRELEVLSLVGNGYSTIEIARELNLSVKTISTHRLRIRNKLNLKNNSELIRYAVQWVHGE